MTVKYVFCSAYHGNPSILDVFDKYATVCDSFDEASKGQSSLLVGEECGEVFAVTENEITHNFPGNYASHWYRNIGDLPEHMKDLTGSFEIEPGVYGYAVGGKIWQLMRPTYNANKFNEKQWARLNEYLTTGNPAKREMWKWFWYDDEHVCKY